MSGAEQFLDGLDALGVPIFTAPRGGKEFVDRPNGWADLDAAGNGQRRARWQPGDALCGVMGGRVVGLDCDPRNGCDPAEVRRAMGEIGVRIYADVSTPGDGAHVYVAGHPDLATAMTLDGLPGLEVHSFGSCLYLPGTQRPKYAGRGYIVTCDDLAALLDGGDDDSAVALLDWVDAHRPGSGESFPLAPPWNGTAPDARQAAYLSAALDGQAAELAAMAPDTGRNRALYTGALKLGNYVAGAGLAEHDVTKALTAACERNRLIADDGARSVAASIRSGLRNGKRRPRAVPPAPEVAVLYESAGDELWQARPALARVHAFARARRASPWATLGVVLARVVAAVDPVVMLPPLIGTHASVNLYVALVGESGAGKDSAIGAATDAVSLAGTHIELASPGSGEGIAHAYMTRVKTEIVQHTRRVLFVAPEVDTIAALGQRSASTLLPELRRAWMGQQIGFQYVDRAKRLPVPAHCYRLCLIVGVQPRRAGALLDDHDGGTPQRFVWLPTADPGMPDQRPPEPEPWQWPTLQQRHPEPDATAPGPREMDVCPEARAEIDASHLARARGVGDPLDGHRLLCRLKVGAALALLDGRLDVTADDWRLAGLVMDRSAATRAGVVAALGEQHRQANRARGRDDAERAAVVAEHGAERATQRVARRLAQVLRDDGGWIAWAKLYRGTTSADRQYVDDALDRAVKAGEIEREDVPGQGQSGRRYRAVA